VRRLPVERVHEQLLAEECAPCGGGVRTRQPTDAVFNLSRARAAAGSGALLEDRARYRNGQRRRIQREWLTLFVIKTRDIRP
jgi:hypothetical protein